MNRPPIYYIKILTLAGVIIAAPLEVGAVTFSQAMYVHGSRNLGSATIDLLQPVGANAHLHVVYDTLDYEQRVEIYDREDLLGDPVWTGVLTQLPSDLGSNQIQAAGIMRRLDTRRLRRDHTLDGNASTLAQSMLQTYDWTFKDDFNRAAIGANWTFLGAGTNWSIVSNYLNKTAADGDRIQTALGFAASTWGNCKISYDFYFPSDNTDSSVSLVMDAVLSIYRISIYSPKNTITSNGVDAFIDDINAVSSIAPMQLDTWNHADVYLSTTGGTTTAILFVNNVKVFTSTFVPSGGPTAFEFDIDQVGTSTMRLDNVVIAPLAYRLTVGDFDATADTIEQTFNGDTYLDAFEWICDHENWEYIVHPKAGATNDIVDCGASVGRDLSEFMVLEEGINISELRRLRTSDSLATSLSVYGQNSDTVIENFICNDLAAFDTYGVIEEDMSDPRVTDATIARTLGNYEVARRSGGNVSLSARVFDESYIIEQGGAVWGSAIWEAFEWGTSVEDSAARLRPGDTVWVKSPRLNIDEAKLIVETTRRSGDPSVDLVFEYFPQRRSSQLPELRRQFDLSKREYMKRMDSHTLPFIFTSDVEIDLPLILRGNYKSVYIDVQSDNWGGSTARLGLTVPVTGALDPTLLTLALFGYTPLTKNAHALDTSWMLVAGDYIVKILPSAGTTALNIVVTITPNLLG